MIFRLSSGVRNSCVLSAGVLLLIFVRVAQCQGHPISRFESDAADAHFNRGNAAARKHDYVYAIAEYIQAIQLKSDFAMAYYNRGIAYNHTSDYPHAISDFSQTIRLKPGDAGAYYSRGIVWFILRNFDKAQMDIKKCRAMGGNPDPAFIQRLEKGIRRTG